MFWSQSVTNTVRTVKLFKVVKSQVVREEPIHTHHEKLGLSNETAGEIGSGETDKLHFPSVRSAGLAAAAQLTVSYLS